MSEMNTVRINLVPVGSEKPPPELLGTVAGTGKWQICITSITFMAVFVYGIDVFSTKTASPHNLNYTCTSNNASKCFNADGTKCTHFTFTEKFKMNTFTQTLLLVCEHEDTAVWVKNCFRIGMVVGYNLTGWCADKLGQKITAMIFIPLQCMMGVFLLNVTNIYLFLTSAILGGMCSTSMYLLFKIAVCEVIGNRWRTLIMGFTIIPLPFSLVVLPYFYDLFTDMHALVGLTSVLPLIFLVPLLYFRESPSNNLLNNDFKKAGEAIIKIAKFNNYPMTNDTRIRPVQIIENTPPEPHLCRLFWKSAETRNVCLALQVQWFFLGFGADILFVYLYNNEFEITTYCGLTGVLGVIVAVGLCELIKHKIIIGISKFLKNITILGIFLLESHVNNTPNDSRSTILQLLSSFFIFAAYGALDNLTPRMFPTDVRGRGVGLCVSTYYAGTILAALIFTYSHKRAIWGMVTLLIIVSPIFETISCFWLWDVHKRELPDFFVDAKNFTKFYKPVRFIAIHEQNVASNEVEVTNVDLSLDPFSDSHVSRKKK